MPKVVEEVRRQFREITGLMEGKAKPEYSRCVDIPTKDALRDMVPPFNNLTAPVPTVRTQVVRLDFSDISAEIGT